MSIIKNPKQGLGKSAGDMSRWNVPTPGGYSPDTSVAKPKGGAGGGAKASKTATTPSVQTNLVAGIKSRY